MNILSSFLNQSNDVFSYIKKIAISVAVFVVGIFLLKYLFYIVAAGFIAYSAYKAYSRVKTMFASKINTKTNTKASNKDHIHTIDTLEVIDLAIKENKVIDVEYR